MSPLDRHDHIRSRVAALAGFDVHFVIETFQNINEWGFLNAANDCFNVKAQLAISKTDKSLHEAAWKVATFFVRRQLPGTQPSTETRP